MLVETHLLSNLRCETETKRGYCFCHLISLPFYLIKFKLL